MGGCSLVSALPPDDALLAKELASLIPVMFCAAPAGNDCQHIACTVSYLLEQRYKPRRGVFKATSAFARKFSDIKIFAYVTHVHTPYQS
jgi:hypothetical protein